MVTISDPVTFGLVFGTIALYLLIALNYLGLHTVALVDLYRHRGDEATADDREDAVRPGVGIIVPAYDEEETILDSLPSFLNLDYPDTEVVVVNDGSTDETLDRLLEAYDLTATELSREPPCEPVRAVYEAAGDVSLRVIDKENGGKSDALNAGIWATDKPLFCAVDSDTIIEPGALFEVVEPFYDRPEEVAAAGGTIRVANGCTIEDGRVVDVGLSSNPLVSIQAMEYLRSFYLGRMGLSHFDTLLLISGAFGVFRTDLVRDIGGYRVDTVAEDFELIIRLHRHLATLEATYDIAYVPTAVAWTEVPSSLSVLGTQRRRWFRGMLETLSTHRDMIGSRRYGAIGVYALPLYVIAELLGPLLEAVGFVVLPVAYLTGWISLVPFLVFMAVTSGFGVVLSWYALLGERLTAGGYERPSDLVVLAAHGIVENVGYRQWKSLVAFHALVEYIRGDQQWGRMEREGLD